MAPTHLPDDPDAWPSNPFALLGIATNVDQRTARRAYLKLVRIFKPDRHPREFQLIREAFETAEKLIGSPLAEYFSPDSESSFDPEGNPSPFSNDQETGVPESLDPETMNPESMDQDILDGHTILDFSAWTSPLGSESLEDEGPSSPPNGYRPGSIGDQLQGIWEDAVAGRWSDAYVRLQSQWEKGAAEEEHFAALFWLLRIVPELDSERDAIDWLYEGMRTRGFGHILINLYHNELVLAPSEAEATESSAVLEREANPEELALVARQRWEALLQRERCDLILADLSALESPLRELSERVWLHVVLGAMNFLVFSENVEIVEEGVGFATAQVESLPYLQLECDALLDRFELMTQLGRELRDIPYTPEYEILMWARLVPFVCNLDFGTIRSRLLPALKSFGCDPVGTLETLDCFNRHSSLGCLQVCQFFEESRYSGPSAAGDTEDEEEEIAAELVEQLMSWAPAYVEYVAARSHLLKFCIDQSISPIFVCRIADEQLAIENQQGNWTDHVGVDIALRACYAGYRLFWA